MKDTFTEKDLANCINAVRYIVGRNFDLLENEMNNLHPNFVKRIQKTIRQYSITLERLEKK